jgi:hypothetical protein
MLSLPHASADCQLEYLLPLGIAGASPGTDFIDAAKTANTDIVAIESAFAYTGRRDAEGLISSQNCHDQIQGDY